MSNKQTSTVSDITKFFTDSTRAENDAANKIREKVLEQMCDPPKEFLEHEEHGNSWRTVHQKWKDALHAIAHDIGPYTSTTIRMKGGRKFHYDADVMYYRDTTLLATRMIEFKHGGTTIDGLPQFLNLPTRFGLFETLYQEYWYDHYLDQYLACDSGLTEPKPTREAYLKCVTKTVYSVTPFITQLKERELSFQLEKNEVVNRSITDYLTTHGHSIDIPAFCAKVQETQRGKIFVLWANGTFHIDTMSETEMTGMTYHSILNGNVLVLSAGNTEYHLLLRWKNHKGILCPAFQISMKRK